MKAFIHTPVKKDFSSVFHWFGAPMGNILQWCKTTTLCRSKWANISPSLKSKIFSTETISCYLRKRFLAKIPTLLAGNSPFDTIIGRLYSQTICKTKQFEAENLHPTSTGDVIITSCSSRSYNKTPTDNLAYQNFMFARKVTEMSKIGAFDFVDYMRVILTGFFNKKLPISLPKCPLETSLIFV